MRQAIDKYKDACDLGTFGAIKQGTFCYPESLDILVDGVKTQAADGKKMKFLRSIPRDPFTNSKEWGLRSMQDDIKSETWSGDNVFNVYTKTRDKDSRWQALCGMVAGRRRRNQRGMTLHRAGGGVHHHAGAVHAGAAAGADQDPHSSASPTCATTWRNAQCHRQVQGQLRQGYFGPPKLGSDCYPDTLDVLVEGKVLANDPNGTKLKFLRRIPKDPFTGKYEWGMRSPQDDPKSQELGGPVRVRRIHQDRGEGPGWYTLCRMVKASAAAAASLSSS